MKRIAWGALLLLGLLFAPAAWGRQRVAVLIVSDDEAIAGDHDLTDSLGDVAIAALADIPDTELVGTRELRRPLAEIVGARGWTACLADAACLVRIGGVADAPWAVIGLVRRRNGQSNDGVVLEIALADTRAAVIDARVSRDVAPDAGALIAGVQRGVAELLAQRPRLQPPPPPRSPPPPAAARAAPLVPPLTATAGAAQAVPLLDIRSGGGAPATDRGRDRNAPFPLSMITYGAAGLAVISFSGGVVTGALADEAPTGNSRLQKQVDLERRAGLAHVANELFITGAVLAAISVAGIFWQRHRAGISAGPRPGSSP